MCGEAMLLSCNVDIFGALCVKGILVVNCKRGYPMLNVLGFRRSVCVGVWRVRSSLCVLRVS